MDVYDTIVARFYDGAYATLRDPSGDVAFYRALAREAGGPVLELACGTGRVLLPIARDGVAATGLDLSPAMLDALRAKGPPANLRLFAAPMQDFDLAPERFALVFSAFRGFQHLYTVEAQLACLACVRRHLAPGGRLAFDVFQPDLSRLAVDEEESEDARFVQDGVEVVRRVAVTRDRLTQTMRLELRWERWNAGTLVGEERTTLRMRWFHRYELEHLLARAGFAVEALYGGFDRRSLGPDAAEIVIVARAA
jgi:SAM-dependent methyltransferase